MAEEKEYKVTDKDMEYNCFYCGNFDDDVLERMIRWGEFPPKPGNYQCCDECEHCEEYWKERGAWFNE